MFTNINTSIMCKDEEIRRQRDYLCLVMSGMNRVLKGIMSCNPAVSVVKTS